MHDAVMGLIGRPTAWLEWKLRRVLHSRDTLEHREGTSELDGTGLLVARAERLPVLWKDEGLLYVGYPSPAHSFWRAQELSLFLRHKPAFRAPVMDFGCGDGSFASTLFDTIDVGVDKDAGALRVAREYGLYRRLVESGDASIPLEKASVQTVFSNSVLEHLVHLDPILDEIRRVLAPGGALYFTVPVTAFKRHLARYFGEEESVRVNVQYYHRNLLSPREWEERLAGRGFRVERIVPFQPPWFTFTYRMLRLFGRKALGRLIPGLGRTLWSRCGPRLVRMVRASLASAPDGANIFVVARVPGP